MPKLIQLSSPYLAGQSPYDIFKDRMSAINSLAQGISKIISNKYYSGLLGATVEDITNPTTSDKVSKTSSLINGEPPDDVVNQQEINEFSTSVVDFLEQSTHGAMYNKEVLQGNLPIEQTEQPLLPSADIVSGETATQEQSFVLPKGSIQTILSYVDSMGGNVNLTKAMEMIKNRPKWLPVSGLEQSILNYALNQPTPQEKLGTNLKLAKTMQDVLYPEVAQQREIDTYTQKLIAQKEVEKQYKEKPLSAEEMEEKVRAMTPEGYEATNIQYYGGDKINVNLKKVSPDAESINLDKVAEEAKKQGLQIYSVKYDENGISDIIFRNPEATTSTDRVTTAEANFVTKELAQVKTMEQYDRAVERIRAIDKNVPITPAGEVFMGNYNKAVKLIKQLVDDKGRIRDMVSAKSQLPYKEIYRIAYQDVETAIEEYKKATGIELPNPFVSLEEYEVRDIKPDTLNPFTWGGQKSVYK